MSETRSGWRGFSWQARAKRSAPHLPHAGLTSLTIGALGVVFGAIGTLSLIHI